MCDMVVMHYTGQCADGPDEGNLVTAPREWMCVVTYFRDLGPGNADAQVLKGRYVWNAESQTWKWKLAKEKS